MNELVFIITKRADDYHCSVAGKPEIWGCGKSSDEALGIALRTFLSLEQSMSKIMHYDGGWKSLPDIFPPAGTYEEFIKNLEDDGWTKVIEYGSVETGLQLDYWEAPGDLTDEWLLILHSRDSFFRILVTDFPNLVKVMKELLPIVGQGRSTHTVSTYELTKADKDCAERYSKCKPVRHGNLHERMKHLIAMTWKTSPHIKQNVPADVADAMCELETELKHYEPANPPYGQRSFS